MITKEEITTIQERIAKDQKKEIEITTRIKSDMEYLEKHYGIKSLDELEKELDKIDENLDKLEKELETKGDALKGAYEWDL